LSGHPEHVMPGEIERISDLFSEDSL
jgi:hypothetical protein